ncbi:sodium:proton antiporter NhaD [Leucothrix arctica]|uniref:Sodium:proton antiporter n=1 Tax=Leucothrix arctica TaxID=1481894 RepID=A0A317CC54_9GAMM|nr:sodium:proton antiporter NhaD [Leucothrix arctica]PWQ96265.1 sodium:proton antiporter [Leucothrix arctica]
MNTLLLILIGLGFLSIVIEDLTHINKAKTTLFFGSLVWLLYFIGQSPHTEEVHLALNENLLEIATLWLFLLSAMTFVAYLNNRNLISGIVLRLLPQKLSKRTLLFMTAHFAFVFSSLADNVTSTLVCMSLLLPLNLSKSDFLRFAAVTVFGVNSGGVSLITGDVTTLMVFMADKVTIPNLLLLIVPAYFGLIALTLVLGLKLEGDVIVEHEKKKIPGIDLIAGGQFLLTIVAILALNIMYDVPPVLTFLVSLGLLFLIMQFLNGDEDMMRNVRMIEFDALLFFLGVLLMVGMLKQLGTLSNLSDLYTIMPTPIANYVLGLLSSLVDNVPLTAAVLHSEVSMDDGNWLSLVYAVGVGGSLLIIGSAAGIIAMSKAGHELLSFMSYARFSGHLLLAYTIGFAASWGVGHMLALA